MAYKTEIQVKVDGLSQVKKLEETLTRVNAVQARINKRAASKIVDIGRVNAETKALTGLNRELERNIALQGKASRGGGRSGGGGGGGRPGGGGGGGVNRLESAALGVGFPLLFGGGAGQVLGGLAGSFVGSGFGGQILGSAIGGQIEDAIARTAELGRALEGLDLNVLADSTLLVNAELRKAVQNSIDLGESQKAVELLARETLAQTGLLPESVNDTTEAALRLSNAWDESVGAVNGLVALTSTDLVNALAVTLKIVNSIVKLTNTLLGKVRELSDNEFVKLALRILPIIGPLEQGRQILADTLKLTKGVDEAAEERKFKLIQSRKELEKELELDNQLLAIEQRRVAGSDAAAKLTNAQAERDKKMLELKSKTEAELLEVRKKFGPLNTDALESLIRQSALNEKIRIDKKFQLDEERAGQLALKELEKERKKIAKEAQEIRARESQIGQARIQTQLSELANEEKIFQIRQQTAAASLQLDQARFDAQLSLLRLQESRLQRELDGLEKLNTNFERQRELIDAIARNRANQAKVENQVAKVQAQQGVRQAVIAEQQIKLQVQRIRLELQLQRIKAQGEKDAEVRLAQLRTINAIEKQNNALTSVMLGEASNRVKIAAQIAKEQEKVADNLLKGKLESIEAERVEARRAVNARELAKATGQAADEAARLNSSMSGGGRRSSQTSSTSLPIDPDVEASVKASKPFGFRNIFELTKALDEAQRAKNAQTARNARMSRPRSSSYSSRYNTGTTLAAKPLTSTVNVNTGPVMQVDNKRYVSMEDFESGLQQVARSTAQNSRSYGSRRYGGIR